LFFLRKWDLEIEDLTPISPIIHHNFIVQPIGITLKDNTKTIFFPQKQGYCKIFVQQDST